MSSPFPGMDPYLENPQFRRAIHTRLIGALDDAIREQLPEGLFTTIEERIYLSFNETAYPNLAQRHSKPPADLSDSPHF